MILLISDSFLKLQKVNKEEYFLPQLNVLDSAKMHEFEIIWSEDKPIVEAALDIKEKILKSPTPVKILAHGKGGLDVIECLIQYPDLQENVEKLVTIQTPIWGTPIADFLTGHPLMGVMTRLACKLMSCSVKVIEEMSELNRQVYMIVNKEKIRQLLENVSVVSVGTSFELPYKTETRFEKIMKQIQILVSKYGGANDGIVPLRSTRISNELHVQLQNVTHLTSVIPNLSVGPEIVDLTRNVLSLVKPSGPSVYPSKFPWGQSEAHSDPKPGRPYQLEIS